MIKKLSPAPIYNDSLKCNKIKILTSLMLFFLMGLFVHAQDHPVHKIRLDPDNARGGNVSDFFEDVSFIPLETNKESLFGQIYQMQVTNECLIIYDSETNAILIFEHNGKFRAKINRRKPNEYFGSFTLNRDDHEIILNTKELLLFYDYNGVFLREQKIDLNLGRILHLGKDSSPRYALHINRPTKASKEDSIAYDLAFTDNFEELTKELFPYNPRNEWYQYNLPQNIFTDQGDGTFMFSFPYRYNVFEMSSKGIIQEFNFVFPEKHSLPFGFATELSFAKNRKEHIFNPKSENYNHYIFLGPFYRYGDWILFFGDRIVSYMSNYSDFIYNLKTKDTFSLNLLMGTEMSGFMPVLQASQWQKMLAVYQDRLYTSMSSANYMRALERLKKDGKEIEDKLPSISNKDNPVVIISTFKKEIK